jgi:hypothetical protein
MLSHRINQHGDHLGDAGIPQRKLQKSLAFSDPILIDRAFDGGASIREGLVMTQAFNNRPIIAMKVSSAATNHCWPPVA